MLLHQLQCLLAVNVLSQGLQDSGRVSPHTSQLLSALTTPWMLNPALASFHKHQDRTAAAQLLQAPTCQPVGFGSVLDGQLQPCGDLLLAMGLPEVSKAGSSYMTAPP